MNENNIIKFMWNKFAKLVDEKIEKLKSNSDKTFKATIWKINSDNTSQINYKKQLYDVPNALSTTLFLGQSVWVKIPSGILRDMHICGIARK